jgi:hypothetical protein
LLISLFKISTPVGSAAKARRHSVGGYEGKLLGWIEGRLLGIARPTSKATGERPFVSRASWLGDCEGEGVHAVDSRGLTGAGVHDCKEVGLSVAQGCVIGEEVDFNFNTEIIS